MSSYSFGRDARVAARHLHKMIHVLGGEEGLSHERLEGVYGHMWPDGAFETVVLIGVMNGTIEHRDGRYYAVR